MPTNRKNDTESIRNDAPQFHEALRECEERHCLFSENIADVVWTMNLDLQITFVSKSITRLLQYTPDEIRQTHIKKLLAPASYKTAFETFKHLLNGNGSSCLPQVMELEHIKKDGSSIWAETKVNLVRDSLDAVVGLLGVSRDISDRKKGEEVSSKLEARLMNTQRLEAIGTLAGGIAHDFNNILTTILGYCELLMKDLDASHALYNDLKQIRSAAVRGETLVRQLLIFSRKQQMNFIAVNINNVINELLMMLYRLIGEDITVTTDLESAIWSIKADAGKIEQVIMNLAVNARDAMPRGGKLVIQTENRTVTDDETKILPDAQPGNFVCLTVTDSGSGMENDIRDKIFEPFFTTKKPGQGAGLGLSTVYGIVKQHRGWINVFSEPGTGTVFKVYFPALPDRPKEKTKGKAALEKYQGNRERILFVEDDPALREITSRSLTKYNYDVHVAASAEDALVVFLQEQQNFHLVLSDVVLPNKSGLELVAELLSQKPGLKVILSSGYMDDKSHWPEIRKKGYRFLRKPYITEDLLKNIRMALQYA